MWGWDRELRRSYQIFIGGYNRLSRRFSQLLRKFMCFLMQTCFYFVLHLKMLLHVKLRNSMWMHRAIVKQVILVFHDLDTGEISSRLSYLVKTLIKVANFVVVRQFEPLSFLMFFLLFIEVARPLSTLWCSVCGQNLRLLSWGPSAELLLDSDRRNWS